jgi:hypothetical protein
MTESRWPDTGGPPVDDRTVPTAAGVLAVRGRAELFTTM